MVFDLEKCCGCGACANVCPKDAIQWVENAEGFREPKIDDSRCVDCGLCRKVCPYETNHVGISADPDVYAAVHKDREVVRQSSSGGAFTAVSDWILDQNGVIYGVQFDADYQVCYRRAETREVRDAFRGSKYVQCDGKTIFPSVEADLRSGRIVLFTGTPCQVSGLKQYLAVKRAPVEKLYLVDNICHGAASPMVWKEYLDYIRSDVLQGTEIRQFSMRSKREKWQKQMLTCETDCGDESEVLNGKASWNRLYQSTYLLRPSCFQCSFTSYDRVSDLTLADYWNVENAGVSLDYSDGVSLILSNSEKGKFLLEQCKRDLILEKSNKKACWQVHLESPTPPQGKRTVFWENYQSAPQETIRKNLRGSLQTRLARAVTPALRKLGLYTLAVRILCAIKKNGNANEK